MLIEWEPASFVLQLARAADVAVSLVIFGTLLVALAVAPRDGDARAREPLARLLRAALPVKIATALLWLPLQAWRMAGGEAGEGFLPLLRAVAFETTFGQALFLRTALLALAVLVAGRLGHRLRLWPALLLAAAALALQARMGHAAAQDTLLLTPFLALHVLAAGAWLGALPALGLLVAGLSDEAAGRAAKRFSVVGVVAVVVLAETALFQSLLLVGGFGGWFGTAYGQLAIAKVAGFALLLLLAAVNRFALTPRLVVGGRGLVAGIAVETAVGVAVVFAAAWLAATPPGAHAQPVWPFPLRPDFSRIDDPYIRRQAVDAGLIALAVLLGLLSLFWRRTRIAGPLLAAVAVWYLPAPNLRLLATDAVATSYYRSPTGYTAASIARGEELLRAHCTADCFRPNDDPSDLTPYNIWARADGDLFDWLVRVFDRIGHSPFPHGVIATFSEDDRWHLIDYFRARVAGSAVKAENRWRYTVPAPDFIATCADGPVALRELPRGPVRIVLAPAGDAFDGAPPPADLRLTTVFVSRGESAAPPSPGACGAALPEAWTALAVAGGLETAAAGGAQFIVDAEGWMRSRILPGETLDAEEWRREIALIEAVPPRPASAGGGSHAH